MPHYTYDCFRFAFLKSLYHVFFSLKIPYWVIFSFINTVSSKRKQALKVSRSLGSHRPASKQLTTVPLKHGDNEPWGHLGAGDTLLCPFHLAGPSGGPACNGKLQQETVIRSQIYGSRESQQRREALLSWSYWLAVPLLTPSNPIICVHPSLPATLGNIAYFLRCRQGIALWPKCVTND